jgi:hypothetical protein
MTRNFEKSNQMYSKVYELQSEMDEIDKAVKMEEQVIEN